MSHQIVELVLHGFKPTESSIHSSIRREGGTMCTSRKRFVVRLHDRYRSSFFAHDEALLSLVRHSSVIMTVSEIDPRVN